MNKLIVFSAMEPLALSGDAKLAVAVIYGLFLGVLLVKCDFSDRVIVKDNLTFKSMRMLKLLLLTLALGMVVFALLRDHHVVQQHIASLPFWGVLAGGIISGIGLGMNGLIPITAVSALASGRIYAVWSMIGMALALPAANFIRNNCGGVLSKFSGNINTTLASENGTWVLDNPALWVAGIALILFIIIAVLGKKEK
ncbi:MAG: YeeE/YedE family protein [Lentisphaeria bacterium]|nr:YeeE/YedE family protein [Lentisphaeria bacterium]MBR7144072.1 YeeE/YedE family protein [Lentisphaeria bacterium]